MNDEQTFSLYKMEPADELQFCDPDIQEAFRGKNYICGTPTQVQLARNLRELANSHDKGQSKSRDGNNGTNTGRER